MCKYYSADVDNHICMCLFGRIFFFLVCVYAHIYLLWMCVYLCVYFVAWVEACLCLRKLLNAYTCVCVKACKVCSVNESTKLVHLCMHEWASGRMRVSLQGRSWPPDIYYLLAYHFPAVLSHLKRLFIYRKFNFVVEDKQSGMKDKFIILSRIFFKNRQEKKKRERLANSSI